MAEFAQCFGFDLGDALAGYRIKCGPTMVGNSREAITLVDFQNFGK